MQFRFTWIVLVVAIVLGAAVWFLEVRNKQDASEAEAKLRLLSLPASTIEEIRIQHSGTAFQLLRKPGGWVLANPVSAPCDESVVAAFLDKLDAARKEQKVGSGDLARYGLDYPTSVVELRSADGRGHELRFGRINPLQTLVYVVIDGSDEVLLTTSELLTMSLATAFGWRDKVLIDVDPETVHRMRIFTLLEDPMSVRRDPNAGWVLEGDVPWRADPIRTRDLLLALSRLRAVGVSSEAKIELNKRGLDNRKLSVLLEDDDGNAVGDAVFGWAHVDGSNYAIVPKKPEIFRVDSKLISAMTSFARDCRHRSVFQPFDPAAVRRLEVWSASDTFSVVKASVTRWKVDSSLHEDSTFVIDPARLQETLEDLVAMQIDAFPETQPPATLYEPAEIVVKLYDQDEFLGGVAVGRKDPNGLLTFARGIDEPAVFLVSPASLIRLPFELHRLGHDEIEAPHDANRG